MKTCVDYNERGHQKSLDGLGVGCGIANKLLPFTPADVDKGHVPFLSFSGLDLLDLVLSHRVSG